MKATFEGLTLDQVAEIADTAFRGAQMLIKKLADRISTLEGIIFEDLHPDSCTDELNRAVVEAIREERTGPEVH